MQSQEVKIKPIVKVVLKSDAEVLDEVVVTAYGTSTKGSFTGSAAVMKADKIEKRQVSNVSWSKELRCTDKLKELSGKSLRSYL